MTCLFDSRVVREWKSGITVLVLSVGLTCVVIIYCRYP